MNQRQQYFKYYSRLLGWISAEQLQQLSQENISFEEFVESNQLFTSAQWDGLSFVLANLVFLKAVQDLNLLSPEQAENLLNEKLAEIREGKLVADLKSLRQNMIPLQSIPQIIPRMRQQGILTDQELSRILAIVQPYYAQAKSQTVPKAEEKTVHTIKALGNYQIIDEIGAGGMGKVYKAYDPKLDRTVAVKVMLNQSSEIAKQRFLSEARLTAKLQHPNIIAIHDINSQNGMVYIVMDFIMGKALDDILTNEEMPIARTIKIMAAVASAIGYAHDNNIIHRDLKPANLLMETANDRPIVMDFGLAKNLEFSDGVTQTGQVLGTPRYMAPEQADGKSSTHLVDIYALGAILYEMLTGTPAVTGQTMAQIVYQITQKKVTPPREVNPNIPEYLEKVCLKAMAKNSKERYQNAHEFAAALGQGSIDKSIPAVKRLDKSKQIEKTVSRKPRAKTIDKTSMRRVKKRPKKQKNPAMLWSGILGAILVVIMIWGFSGGTKETTEPHIDQKIKQQLAEQQKQLEEQKKLLEKQAQRQKQIEEERRQLLAKKQLEDRQQELAQETEQKRLYDEQQKRLQELEIEKKRIEEERLKQAKEYEKKLALEKKQAQMAAQNLEEFQGEAEKQRLAEEQQRQKEEEAERQRLAEEAQQKQQQEKKQLSRIELEVKYKAASGATELSFRGSRITDEMLAYLKNNTNITKLDLQETDITDAGLRYLQNMKSLRYLDLQKTKVRGVGFIYLMNCKRLYAVDLDKSLVDDEGIKEIVKLPLRQLHIERTDVTDAAIPYLLKLRRNFRELKIIDTRISLDGCEKLKRSLPNCKIEYFERDK